MIPIDSFTGRMGNRMFQYAYLYALVRQGIIPDVYVQDYRYFEPYIQELKQIFGHGIGYVDKVALHVRRGDYVKSDFHFHLWETDYYERAVKLFPDDSFIIFCADRQGSEQDRDDYEWCVSYFTNLLGDRFEMVNGNNEVDDMNLQASCKHNIIANSSFSYWAALINPHGGRVIAPKQWYADGQERTFCPQHWERL